ncbi:effector-associated constant component EACC1 [Actinophytocola sp.]|uniref:effector-associated constant component EACC1 n=1 Tax=Actinophytocola sp. TaxID=1872138 RepID=UPI002ED29196
MDATIQVSGDDGTELSALWDWLRKERALAGSLRAQPRSAVDGQLGGAFEVLSVAVGSGGAVAVLAHSLTAWLRTRKSDITVTVKTATRSVSINARRVGTTDEVIALLESAMRHDTET